MNNRIIVASLFLILSLTSCQPVATPAPAPVALTATPFLPNLLILTEAQVQVRRKDSLAPVAVALGAEVSPGDTITVTQGSAALFCGAEADWDASPRALAVGKVAGVPCGEGRPPRPYPDAAMVRSRGGEERPAASEIYILSPRSGWVMNDRPTLVWQEIAGADSYTVTLESDDGITRTIVAAGSPLSYPSDWKPLEAEGASYQLLVTAGDKSSGDETPGFSLLEDQDEFKAKIERLQQRVPAEPARTLLLAELYLSRNLRSEAIDLLTALADADEIIAVQSLLGETYLNMGLVAQGQAAYTRMAELGESQGFIESQAQALTGLGWAACAARDLDGANEHWSQAYALYDQHGLAAQTETVNALLVGTDKRCR